MLKISHIYRSNVDYANKKNNSKRTENVSFCGEQSVSDRAKQFAGATALASIMLVGIGCSGNNDDRYGDAVTSRSDLFNPRYIYHDTVKIENGCGFETNSKRYVMSDGVLWGYNKSTHQWYKASGFSTLNYLFRTFARIADENDEIDGKLVLSKKDIEKVMDDPERLWGNEPGSSRMYRYAKTEDDKLIIDEDQGGRYIYNSEADKEPSFLYGMKYLDMSPVDIANDISEQISGYSDNDITIAMINAISDKKIVDVAKKYKEKNGEGLIEALSREFSMGGRHIMDLIVRLKINSQDLSYDQVQELKNLSEKFYKDYIYDGFEDGRTVWNYKNVRRMDNIICQTED